METNTKAVASRVQLHKLVNVVRHLTILRADLQEISERCGWDTTFTYDALQLAIAKGQLAKAGMAHYKAVNRG